MGAMLSASSNDFSIRMQNSCRKEIQIHNIFSKFQAAYCLGGEVACVLTRGWLSWLSSVFVGAAWQMYFFWGELSPAVASMFQLQPLQFHSV